ncbi:MAG: amidase [Solirubrobacteraceae bacterium]|nr:amidase [Solirubrobacteraceae bacterium]
MPVQPPSSADLTRIAASFGMPLSENELEHYTALAGGLVASYGRVDELDAPPRPVKYPRAEVGHRPLGEENPCNGWAWKCSIPGASEGPLSGVRVGIKDNICVSGIPMLNGSEMLEGFVPREDATVVTRLLDAGAEVVGKTAVPAFCFDGGHVTGYPHPEPVNPHDPTRLPGSSSSGSAVVVALGEADMALGGDQGGSIRMPSSWSGTVGHKPTWGLVPYTGAFPIELTLDHLGPMARSVRDCARMLEVIAGDDGLDPRWRNNEVTPYVEALDRGAEGLRVGIMTEGFDWPDVSEADVDDAVRAAAATFEGLGATVGEVSVPVHRDGLAIWNAIAVEGATELMVKGNAMGTNWRGHYTTDLLDFYSRARAARSGDYSVTVKLTMLVGEYMAERYGRHYYAKGQNLSRMARASYDEALEQYDVLVMPTTAMKAMKRPGPDASITELVAAALANLHNTAVFDATGHPALSVPCGFSEGLPVGMMLVGRHNDDATVLRAGHAYEQSRGDLPSPARGALATA